MLFAPHAINHSETLALTDELLTGHELRAAETAIKTCLYGLYREAGGTDDFKTYLQERALADVDTLLEWIEQH